jgi:hypothetical protein
MDDSMILWLNVTNTVLGLAVIGFLGLVLFSALRDMRLAARIRAGSAALYPVTP